MFFQHFHARRLRNIHRVSFCFQDVVALRWISMVGIDQHKISPFVPTTTFLLFPTPFAHPSRMPEPRTCWVIHNFEKEIFQLTNTSLNFFFSSSFHSLSPFGNKNTIVKWKVKSEQQQKKSLQSSSNLIQRAHIRIDTRYYERYEPLRLSGVKINAVNLGRADSTLTKLSTCVNAKQFEHTA